MTFIAVASATTVGGARRAAHLELRTSGGSTGAATLSMPAGLADAVVTWATNHLPRLVDRPVEPLFDALGQLEAEWNDLAAGADDHERGAARGAVALVTNAAWDLWSRSNDCPLWKLVVNLSPDHLCRSLDLRWVEDLLSATDARQLLETRVRGRSAREADLRREGYPVVPMVPLPSPEALHQLESMSSAGWPALRVGLAPAADVDQLATVVGQLRELVNRRSRLMVGPDRYWSPAFAAQVFDQLAPLGIDALVEPCDPRDVVALAALRKRSGAGGSRAEIAGGAALSHGIAVKQLLALQAVDVCRIDPGRLGVSTSLTLLLLAARLRTPVCFDACSAGNASMSGLTIALHLAAVDNIAIGASLDRRWVDLGASPDLLAAALNSTPGRCRLPLASGNEHRIDLGYEEKPLSGTARR